jgi:hypothetical protein
MKMPEPRAWAIFTPEGNARMWSTFQPHVQKLADAEGLTITPLYDKQALIDLLEEAAKECDALYFNLNAGPDTCAQALRSMKETL